MSLETLLEAAKYLEWSSQSKARGDDTATDFHPYAKAAPPSDDKQRSPTYKGNSGGSGSNDDREKRRAGGAGTREVHNKLEKNRRAHLKECFEMLKKQLPNMDDKKTSNLSILRSALRYIQTLKRKEKEFEQEMQRLAQEKIATQERIIVLRRELVQMNVDFDMNHWTAGQDHDSDSTSTATADGDHPIMSEDEEEREVEASEAQVINIVPTTPVSKAKLPAPGQPLTVGWSQPAPNTITGRPTPTTVTIARTVATTTTYSMAASKSSGVTVTTAAGPQAVGRTPVTQILHQTITQRAALQQQLAQQKLQQQQQHQQKLQRIQPTPPAHVVTVQAAGGVRPVTQILGTARGSVLPPLRPGLALNHVMAPTGPIVTPAASILAAARQTVGGTAVNTVNQVAAIAAMNKLITGTVSASATPKVAVTTTLTSTTPTVSANQITSPVTLAAPISLSAMKHIIANQIPTAHLVSPVAAAHMPTIGQLMSQQSPRTSAHVNVSQMMSAAVTNIGGTQIMSPTVTQMSTVHPVMSSIAHVIPVTQIVSPMTLVSPAVQASSGLSQTQLNNVVNPPVIKPLGQIPIIQQSFSIQPQVVKPVVTVSVPNVVTTAATTPAVQVTVPVTHAS